MLVYLTFVSSKIKLSKYRKYVLKICQLFIIALFNVRILCFIFLTFYDFSALYVTINVMMVLCDAAECE